MALDKITFGDLFDFNDDTELEKGKRAIKSLLDIYQTLGDRLKTENNESRKAVQGLTRSLGTLEKKLKAVNIASEEGRRQAAAYAQQVSHDVKVINDLKLGQQGLEKQLKDLEAANRRLQKSYDKLAASRQKARDNAKGEAGSINAIQKEINELTAAYKKMGDATDNAVKQQALGRINALSREVRDSKQAMNEARKGSLGLASSYAGLVRENARLIKELRELDGAFDQATGAINIQNKAAVKLQQQIQRNTNALKNMDAQMGMNQRNVGNYGAAANNIKQFGLALAGQFAGVIALAEATRIAFQSNLELSDAQAGVRKTVGLTKEEVDDLAESFKKINTRTTLNNLFEIARVGGQFNVAKKDIEAFTVAADKAAVALSDEFKGGVQEVATELYTLRGLFADTREQSPADALLSIGSAVNTLGAEGAATGPVIAEFAKRLGQLGDLGPDIKTALGMGAALQEMGFSAEIAAGGYTNLIVQANKHLPKFAKLLQMSEEQFRALLKSDPNEIMLQLAQTVKGMDNGIEVLYGMGVQSQESIKVLGALGDRVEFVRQKIATSNKAFTEATSINREFAIANDTLAGSWEKLKNSIIQTVTSGAIGTWLKETIDGIRLLGKEISNITGGESYDMASRAGSDVSATVAQLKLAQEMMEKVEHYNALLVKGYHDNKEFNAVQREMNALLGEGALVLDEATGKYKLSEEALKRHQSTLEKNVQEVARQLLLNKEAAFAAEKEEEAAKKRYNASLALVKVLKQQTGYSKTGVVVSKELRLAEDALAKAEVELEAAQKKRNNIIDDQKTATEALTKAGYDNLAISKLLQAEWVRNADAVKQGEAIWGTAPTLGSGITGQSRKEDGIPTGGGNSLTDDPKKEARDLQQYADALRDAAAAMREYRLSEQISDTEFELKMTPEKDFDRRTRLMKQLSDERIALAGEQARNEKAKAKEAADYQILQINREAAAAKAKGEYNKEMETADAAAKSYIRQTLNQKLLLLDQKLKDDTADIRKQDVVDFDALEKQRLEIAQRTNAALAILRQQQYTDDMSNALDNDITESTFFGGGIKMFDEEVDRRIGMVEEYYKRAKTTRELEMLEQLRQNKDGKEGEMQIMQKYYQDLIALTRAKEKEITGVQMDALQERTQFMMAALDLINEGISAGFEIFNDSLDVQMEHLQHNQQQELATLGEYNGKDEKARQQHEETKAKIQERYAAADLKMRQKRARADKMEALFSIALDTAKGIMGAVAQFPLTAGMPWAGIVAAAGAIQMAVAASKPIPQYWRGTDSSKKGWAEVAERGPELIESKRGFELVSDRQYKYLDYGSKVYTADETRDILSRSDELYARAGMNTQAESYRAATGMISRKKGKSDRTAERLVREVRNMSGKVSDAIRGQKQLHVNIDKGGVRVFGRTGQLWTKYENDKYRR